MSGLAGRGHGHRSVDFLKGIWAAVPTPFAPDGDIDLPGVRANAHRFGDSLRLDGIFCNGLIGELWSLALHERKQILEAALSGAGALKVGTVVTAHSLPDTLELARHAGDAGAHHIVLMSPPGIIQEDDIERYVRTVAGATSTPIVIFDGGAQTGGFSGSLLARFAQDGIISGVKCTRGGDSAEVLRATCENRIPITDPYESHAFSNLLRFDLRTLYADPEPYLFQHPREHMIAAYFAAFAAGDVAQAARLFRDLEPIRHVYHRWIMAPLQNGVPVNAIVKRWFALMGFAAGPVRAPLSALSEDHASTFDTELKDAFSTVYGPEFVFPAMDRSRWKS